MENETHAREFILMGLTNVMGLHTFLFCLFLLFYLASMLGNAAILFIALVEPRLHTPMYFFLCNLSCLDACYSTVTVPKMLAGFLSGQQRISFIGCLSQLHFFHFLGSSEALLLGVMAYDRYVAICNPLRYTSIMSKNACIFWATATWTTGFFHALMHTVMTSQLNFCGPNLIQHFFCDVKPLLRLACLKSKESRMKAFSTCASHLTAVTLFYTGAILTYVPPSSGESLEQEMMVTLMYTVVTPVLNPLIYTLRNQEVKSALKKLVNQKFMPS
ncbi:olfactory receptor 12D1-like [Tiliqua scincoides]|uniref:olfactory receptor 12D1-like n=1 Tax=Tiliqua scincoides TaxID=71010 RepID=UPI0034630168